jgi:hypothetical protein
MTSNCCRFPGAALAWVGRIRCARESLLTHTREVCARESPDTHGWQDCCRSRRVPEVHHMYDLARSEAAEQPPLFARCLARALPALMPVPVPVPVRPALYLRLLPTLAAMPLLRLRCQGSTLPTHRFLSPHHFPFHSLCLTAPRCSQIRVVH